MERSIVHLDLDAFFVSVERLKDSRLAGIPLLIGGTGDRGVVSSCSYEARAFGVHSAMPMRLARRLCPQAIVISGDFDAYTEYSGIVSEIIRERAPLYEKASIDEFYVDLSGMERYFGCLSWTRDLLKRIYREIPLPLSFGLSVNKMVSKVATNIGKPRGDLHIPAPEVLDFLAPMPVRNIPYVGEKTSHKLTYMGVRDIATLREIPRMILEKAFGKQGTFLFRRARGEDDTPVIPYSEQKSISAETTFGQDTIDLKQLRTTLIALTERIAFQLRKQRKLTACVAVKIRYSNFETFTRQTRIPYSCADDQLISRVLQLFEQLYQKRLLVRLVGVRFSHLVPGKHQINLFEDTQKQIRLYQAIDRIKLKHGAKAVRRASGIWGN